MKTNLSELLASRRIKCGFTQDEIADLLDVSRQSVSKWETGDSLPSNKHLITLCYIYDLSISEIIVYF